MEQDHYLYSKKDNIDHITFKTRDFKMPEQ